MLRKIWEHWKVIAEKIGSVQARLILSLLYCVILGPVALVRRVVADPLGLRWGAGQTYWIPRPTAEVTLDSARRQ
jgi:hypothetical protein